MPVIAAPATAVRAFAAATLGRAISAAGARPAVAVVAVVAPAAVTPVVPAPVVPSCFRRRVGAVSRPQWAEASLCARTVVAPLHLLRRGRTQRCSAGFRDGSRSAGRLARTAHRPGRSLTHGCVRAARASSAPRVCGSQEPYADWGCWQQGWVLARCASTLSARASARFLAALQPPGPRAAAAMSRPPVQSQTFKVVLLGEGAARRPARCAQCAGVAS